MKPVHIQMSNTGRVVALWDRRPTDLEAAAAYVTYLNHDKTPEEMAPSIWNSCWLESQPLHEQIAIEGESQRELFEPKATAIINVSVPLGPEDLLELTQELSGVMELISTLTKYATALSAKISGVKEKEPGKVTPLFPEEDHDQ